MESLKCLAAILSLGSSKNEVGSCAIGVRNGVLKQKLRPSGLELGIPFQMLIHLTNHGIQ